MKTVQTALNKLLKLIPPTQALIVDGRLNPRPESSKTIAAIKLFQSKVLNMVRPDGKIDPNGRTYKKLNEKLAVSTNANLSLVFSKADRVTGMERAAQQAMDLHGPDAKMNVELTRCK